MGRAPRTAPPRGFGANVTFEPGAQTAWHTHPLGQTLVVTAGCGLVQSWGGPVKTIRPGDVVWCPPGEKHWHGATPVGVQGIQILLVTPDAAAYAYNVTRKLSELYLVEGLK